MERVLVLRTEREELRASPEFVYLRSLVLNEVRATFERPVVLSAPWSRETIVDRAFDGVLFLADDRVLVCRRTLGAMKQAVLEGHAVAVPSPVAEVAQAPLYTLRDFEVLEEQVIAAPARGRTPQSHLPVSLWSFEALRERVPSLALADVMNPALLVDPSRTASRGIFHPFIDYYAEVREDVLPLVPAGVRNVLEIGCGRGLTGKLLRERLGCRVTGVELNPVAASEARKNLDEVFEGDVQQLELSGQYDLILAFELFEHLVAQEQFLVQARRLLRPEGHILLSVPNVGHYSVVRDLLAGRWDYLPIGLLCFTHFRFFTAHTLRNLFQQQGFTRVEIQPQITELPDEFVEMAAGGNLTLDLDSLKAKGFYVRIRA